MYAYWCVVAHETQGVKMLTAGPHTTQIHPNIRHFVGKISSGVGSRFFSDRSCWRVVNWEFKGEGKLTHNRTWAFLSKLNMYKKGVKCCYATSEDTATTCPAAHSAHVGCSFITALLTNTYNWSVVFKKVESHLSPGEKNKTTHQPQKSLSNDHMQNFFHLRLWTNFFHL